MYDAVNGPLAPGAADPLLDERYACLQQNGVGVASPASIKSYITQRRAYLLTQIPQAAFSASGPAVTSTNQVTLTGTAPVNVRAIEVEGRPLALTWTSVTAWRAAWLLRAGANFLRVTARDDSGAALAATNLAITFPGTNAWPPLRLNEWMASNTGLIRDPADNNADDWFELYNPTASAVDLAGWSLTDMPTNAARFVVPGGYGIPAQGFLLVWADNEIPQNATHRPDLHVNFKLEKNGETLALYAPDGTLIDTVAFDLQTNNVSQGRWPDGGPSLVFLDVPTPRGPNQFTVPAPVFTTCRAAGATVQYRFTTTPGFTYQVEYQDALRRSSWAPLSQATNAAAAGITFQDLMSTNAQRFYRVRLSP
jgi:hypothetical protein